MSANSLLSLRGGSGLLYSQVPDDAPESAKRYNKKLRRSQGLKKAAVMIAVIGAPFLFIGLIELLMFWLLGILSYMFLLPCLFLGGSLILILIAIPLGIAAVASKPNDQDKSDYDAWVKETDLKRAKDAETAGRFEDAARIYEGYQMLEEAGKIRAKHRDLPPPPTDDPSLISYLLKMRQKNKATAYECPNCGANIKITGDTKAVSLQKCEYCGSSLEVDALNNHLSRELD